MTEQIERELTEMFRERAAQLDVLPPLPAARVRRGRLQTGLALASVVAVLAGVMLVGTRLAGGGEDRSFVTTATGQRAQADLAKALRKTFAGRMVATTETVSVPSGKFINAPDLGYSARLGRGEIRETRYDGRTGTAVTTGGGQPTAQLVRDVVYEPVRRNPGEYQPPPLIAWISNTKDAAQSLQEWRDETIGTAIPGLVFLYEMPPQDVSERGGRITLNSPDMGMMSVEIVVQLDHSGRVSTVTSRNILKVPGAVDDRLDRVTFRPVHGAIDAQAPDPITVMSSADYLAAKNAYNEAHKTCTTTPPSTGPDGTSYGETTRCAYPGGSGSGEGSASVSGTLSPAGPGVPASHP